ncbi:MAG: hypothetical protein H0T76_25070 [Nannocystis sp.]|nr:hypothetical protein [Nannocystis sp.]MBA3549765.1 hypothetical protein [Nannocystis sp.]
MSAPPDKTVSLSATRIPPEAQHVPVFEVHGDPDDHLRLSVLLADLFGAHATSNTACEAVADCKNPKTTWSRRLDALRELVRMSSMSKGGYCAVVVDLDGLDTGPLSNEQMWDDRDFSQQRRKLLDEVIIASLDRFKFLLLRPRPALSVSQRLAGHVDEREDSHAPENPRPVTQFLPLLTPETQPILRWIVDRGILPIRDVERLLDACDGVAGEFERNVLATAYESIPPAARTAGKLLSTERGIQTRNGHLGSFKLARPRDSGGDTSQASTTLSDTGVRALEACSFLQDACAERPSALRMPRGVRSMLRPLALLDQPFIVQDVHQRLSNRSLESASLSEKLEIHHHAVQSGDHERALTTSLYYGSDLRQLAFRLSLDGQYAQAARVYRDILDHFDNEDAYAWEYLGYNLALANDKAMSAERAEEVRQAFQRAHELDLHNPLYHGRFLGFRAQCGEDISIEFSRILAKFQRESAERADAISYLTEPILRGLGRGGLSNRRRELIAQWGALLARSPRLRVLLGE